MKTRQALQAQDPVAEAAIFFFLQTQLAIVHGLAANKCPCVGKREEDWMRSVVQDFMRPLLQSLTERSTRKAIADAGGKTFFDEYDKGTWNNFRKAGVRVPEHLATANGMAINHINNDLKNFLTTNGCGTDATWACIGKVVDDSFKAALAPLTANFGAVAGKIWDDMNISEMRDNMRKEVKNTLGPGKEYIP